MSKEFDIYNPGSWVYADEEIIEYLGTKLIDIKSENYISQEKIALFLNDLIMEKKLRFNSDQEFRVLINAVLGSFLEDTMKFNDAQEEIKSGIVPSELSGVCVAGHELTLAQCTVFQLYLMTEKDQEMIVSMYYDGRAKGMNSNRIKQDLFDKLPMYDNSFLVEIMKADNYAAEKNVFIVFLSVWVAESESDEEIKNIFNHSYFDKHPEIKAELCN